MYQHIMGWYHRMFRIRWSLEYWRCHWVGSFLNSLCNHVYTISIIRYMCISLYIYIHIILQGMLSISHCNDIYVYIYTHMESYPFRSIVFCHDMEVSWNRGTPESSILTGCSIVNHPFWGFPMYGNSHIYIYSHY